MIGTNLPMRRNVAHAGKGLIPWMILNSINTAKNTIHAIAGRFVAAVKLLHNTSRAKAIEGGALP